MAKFADINPGKKDSGEEKIPGGMHVC